MLRQEDDLPIQSRGDSSKSPACLQKVKKRTRDEVSKADKLSFILCSIMNTHLVMNPPGKFLTTCVLLFRIYQY